MALTLVTASGSFAQEPEARETSAVATTADEARQADADAVPASGEEVAPTFRPEEYILGGGDRLRVIVFGEEALSGEFVIGSTGTVSLPLIGEVQGERLSVRQFEQRVTEALRDGYLNDPRVSVEVLNFRPFYILGEVQEPGEYPYTSGLTVLNAVATAGGFTALANQTVVFVKSVGEETERQMPLTSLTRVAPGDTIRIAKGAFYILGEVNRPGEYPFTDGLTVMNAVATAQGFTYRANQGRVFITRANDSDERSYRLTPDLRVEPGDTIRIAERFF